jgi:SAM-dependent methyltransferase
MMDSYTILAESYDLLTGDVGYPQWADYIQWHFARQKQPVRSVVELACGTGSLTKLLAQRGYEMTAMDLSPDMLTVASSKCAGLPVQFVCQDMSRLSLPEPVDAVICCLDSVNYVTRPSALQKTFCRVFQALKPGGLFLFDAKTPLALESADDQVYLDETEEVYCVWRGEYDPKRRICGYGIDLFRLRPDGAWDRGSEYHEEYAYTPSELERWLDEADFSGVKQYGNLKKRPPRDGEERVFFAARKGI